MVTDDRWILIPGELAREVEVADLCFNGDLVEVAIRQYLTHLLRCRKYKEKMRDDPNTRDGWYQKRKQTSAKYRTKLKKKDDQVTAPPDAVQLSAVVPSTEAGRPYIPSTRPPVNLSHASDEEKFKEARLERIRKRAEEQ